MFLLGIPAALAAAAAQSAGLAPVPGRSLADTPAAAASFPLLSPSLAADSAMLAASLAGPRLELTRPGSGIAVRADIDADEHGCAAQIAVRAPDGASHRRLLRWTDVAWTGMLPDGRVMVAFFEHEGRLPTDRLSFVPTNPKEFEAGLTRVVEACRGASAEHERTLSSEHSGSRSCYFKRYPGIELIEPTVSTPAGEGTRAVVTMLAEETPEAELRLLVERDPNGDGWREPEVAFTVGGEGIKDFRIGAAHFALDGVTVDVRHSIAVYNGTRLRIRMDSAANGASTGDEGSYYRRLSTSQRATVSLVDSAGVSRAVLNFDAGPVLAAARRALDAAAWSCADAAPTPSPAAPWQIAR